MAVAMPTQTARISWAHLAVLVSQDIMAMDWAALVRKCSVQSFTFVHSHRPVLITGLKQQ